MSEGNGEVSIRQSESPKNKRFARMNNGSSERQPNSRNSEELQKKRSSGSNCLAVERLTIERARQLNCDMEQLTHM